MITVKVSFRGRRAGSMGTLHGIGTWEGNGLTTDEAIKKARMAAINAGFEHTVTTSVTTEGGDSGPTDEDTMTATLKDEAYEAAAYDALTLRVRDEQARDRYTAQFMADAETFNYYNTGEGLQGHLIEDWEP